MRLFDEVTSALDPELVGEVCGVVETAPPAKLFEDPDTEHAKRFLSRMLSSVRGRRPPRRRPPRKPSSTSIHD